MYKKKDLPIIAQLRKNSRMSLTKIGRKTGIPISTVYDRMRIHEGKAIKKYTAVLDFNEFGFNTRVHLLLSLPKDKRIDAQKYFCKHHNINSVYKINNNFDFLVEGIFKHIKHLEDFIDVIEQRFLVDHIEVHHIIEDILREQFMQNPKTANFLLEGA
jgi:DNA-binding Lrp family transcriptional regulator